MTTHHPFQTLVLSPSLSDIVSHFLIGYSFQLDTACIALFTNFPQFISILFSSPPLPAPFLFFCGYAPSFVVYCYRSVAHAAMMSFTSWISGFLCLFHVPFTPLHVPFHRPFTPSHALFSMYIVHHDHSNESQRFFF